MGARNGSAPPGKYDIGVLFVHGIVQQAQGETLASWGESLVAWIRRWRAGTAQPDARTWSVDVTDASVRNPADGAPAHATCRVHLPSDGGADAERRWLLAESWWAASFIAPTFRSVAHWAFVIVPHALNAHFGAQFGRLWRSGQSRLVGRAVGQQGTAAAQSTAPAPAGLGRAALRLVATPVVLLALIVLWVLYSLIATLLSALILVFVTVTVALAILPIPPLRSAARALQVWLSSSLGDSYTFLNNPIQAAAIVGQVRRDLAWVAERSEQVAIIAHSQGAAVTDAALRHRAVAGAAPDASRGAPAWFPRLLITFGSGLNKLTDLRDAYDTGRHRGGWQSLAGLPVLALCAALFRRDPLFAVLFGLPAMLALGAGVGAGLSTVPPRSAYMPRTRFGANLQWRDFYASSDPVANGALFASSAAGNGAEVTTVEVHNRGSLLRDHTTYWQNQDEFVGAVVRAIMALDGQTVDVPGAGTPTTDADVRQHRRFRARLMGVLTILVAALTIAVLVVRRDSLAAVGAALRDLARYLDQTPLAALAGSLRSRLDGLDLRLLGALAIVCAGITAHQLLYWTWRWWDRHNTSRYFARAEYDLGPPAWCLAVGAATIGVAALVGGFGWPARFSGADALMLGGILGFFALVVVCLLSPRETARCVRRRGAGSSRLALATVATVLLATPLLYALLRSGQGSTGHNPNSTVESFFARFDTTPGWYTNGLVEVILGVAVAATAVRLLSPLVVKKAREAAAIGASTTGGEESPPQAPATSMPPLAARSHDD